MVSYGIYAQMAANPALSAASGVVMRSANFFFMEPVNDSPKHLHKMREVQKSGVDGFRHDAKLAVERGVNPSYGVQDGYEHLAPVIDTDVAIGWLMELVTAKGATLVTDTIHGDLLDAEPELRSKYGVDAIVNATGLASATAANDPTAHPSRGALIRVVNDGKNFPKVEHALTISADAHNPNE